jgi:hypothetical protein
MKVIVALIAWLLWSLPSFCQEKIFSLENNQSKDLKTCLKSKQVIVVGEMHGTEEVPKFFLQLVKMAGKPKSLQVALEINKDLQKDIDEFMRTGDFSALLKLDYFKWPDGRSSEAMGNLLRELRAMKIKVVCFDIESTIQTVVNRDSMMAANLAASFNNGKLLVLTGNLHANLEEGFWRPNFKSAVLRLKQLKNLEGKLISLNTYFNGGTIWNCMSDGCKERDAYAQPEWQTKYGLKDFVVITEQRDENGYNGFVYFDKVKASRPLVN